VSHLLVSALRLCPPTGSHARRRRGPHPGLLRPLPGENYLGGLNREKGKFRAFLLASLKRFLANEWDRAGRRKRGGDAAFLSRDWQSADSRYQIDPTDQLSPDKLYDRAWAVTLLERVITCLREACRSQTP